MTMTADGRRERIVAISRVVACRSAGTRVGWGGGTRRRDGGPTAIRRPWPSRGVSAILKTEDVPSTIEWYRRVGFRLEGSSPRPANPRGASSPATAWSCSSSGGETPWPDPPTFTGTLYFYPESLDALHEEIREHTQPAWGPEVREWGSRELGLRDPNGYFLTFTEPAEPHADGAEDGSFTEA
jgi:hypothetical protein